MPFSEDKIVPRFSGYNVWDGVRDGIIESADCENGVFNPPELRSSLLSKPAPPLPFQRQTSVSLDSSSTLLNIPRRPLAPLDPNVKTLQVELDRVEQDVCKLKRVVRLQGCVISKMAALNRQLP